VVSVVDVRNSSEEIFDWWVIDTMDYRQRVLNRYGFSIIMALRTITRRIRNT
jgi:hypothetical protein